MATSTKHGQQSAPVFDREVLKNLARCFARCAVDDMIAQSRDSKKTTTPDQSARKKVRIR
jgi:hypothetical protein